MQVTKFYKMRGVFYIDNMRAEEDLILVAHKLTSACKGHLYKPQVFLLVIPNTKHNGNCPST